MIIMCFKRVSPFCKPTRSAHGRGAAVKQGICPACAAWLREHAHQRTYLQPDAPTRFFNCIKIKADVA